jgi:4-aminobutyrate aminotransferase-like enzyme
MAATGATLTIMQRENAPERTLRSGEYLKQRLLALFEKHAFIGEVRGRGLMLGVELVEDRKSKVPAAAKAVQIMEAAKHNGLLLGKGGLYGNVLRIAPSMLIEQHELEAGCDILEKAFAA